MNLRAFLTVSVLAGVLAGAVAVGVRSCIGNDDAPAAPDPSIPAPVAASPREVAERFAAAWRAWDAAALYALLDADARAATSPAAFADAHAAFRAETAAERIAVSLERAAAGEAVLRVRLETAWFGTLDYTVTLPLARGPDGDPRVGWTPAVLHPALAHGGELRGTVRRPRRGAILDRRGEPLAVTRDERVIGLDRGLVRDEAVVVNAFVSLGYARGAVEAAFASPLGPRQRVPVGVVPDERVAEAARFVQAVPGAVLWFEERRVHPLGPAAAHVVGYTREYTAGELAARADELARPGDRTGAAGLEAALETALAGRAGARLEVVGGARPRVIHERPFVAPADVRTTLDDDVLRAAHAGLAGLRGAAVVIDPRDNAILAIASSPAFDPAAFERGDDDALETLVADERHPLTNRALHGLYPPGSTFKLVTGAAGLAAGLYAPSDRIDCPAVWRGVDPPRRNWEGAQGPLTIARGLMRSCNPVFYEIALRLHEADPAALPDMARAFGFGAASGAAGLDDAPGLVPDADWKRRARAEPWYPGDAVNLGIGQGDLLVTPLQLANAYAAFLTGEARAPVVLADATPAVRGPLGLAPDHAAHLRRGLELVTGSAGTAGWAFAAGGHADFGGKSGTAEDAEGQAHALFVAYAPRDAPAAVAAVVFDDGTEGLSLAAPLARDLVIAARAAPAPER